MANKLAESTKKSMGGKKVAKVIPRPAPPVTTRLVSDHTSVQPKVGGLDPDRYRTAEEALQTLGRAAEHQKNPRLMADARKVMQHKIDSMNQALGGGLTGKGKR